MVKLDPSKDGPMTPLETAKVCNAYPNEMGYEFCSWRCCGPQIEMEVPN
jgi:hypothetical protein